MSGNVATEIDGNGQACNVCRRSFNVNCKRSCFSAEALRSDIKAIDQAQYLLLHFSIKLILITCTYISA